MVAPDIRIGVAIPGEGLVVQRLDLGTTHGGLIAYAAYPDALIVGAVTRDVNGAATSAGVVWPDGDTGIYTGTPSASFPGAVDAYTITKSTATYTQPAVTRDANGVVTNRPAITVS